MHGGNVVRDALCACDAIRKEIVDGIETGPQDATDAHTTWFVGGQKDGALGDGASIFGRSLLGPCKNGLDFAMENGASCFRVGVGEDTLKVLVENSSTENFVSVGNLHFSFREYIVFDSFEHLHKLLGCGSERSSLVVSVDYNARGLIRRHDGNGVLV